jgi:hypothetical protein
MLHASNAWGEARYGQIPDILSHARNKNQREASIFKASLAFEYLRAAALRSHFSDKKTLCCGILLACTLLLHLLEIRR